MDQIAILIPCYNEEPTIRKVIEDCQAFLPQAIVYVYDNNSTDRTYAIAEEAGAVVRKESKQGKGNVIRRMFREIDAQCYIMLDGDDTYPAHHLPDIANLILNHGVDMVVGDRLSSTYFEENKRPFHNIGNIVVRKFINTLFKSNIKDIMTGYRGFNYMFIKTFPVMSQGFEIETEMTIHAINHNMHVENLLVDYRDRPENSYSKLNTVSDGMKVLRTILSLFKNYRPFAFFSVISVLLLLIASLFFTFSVLIPFIKTGTVEKIPTLIVSGFTVIAAIQSFFTGLLLDTLVKKSNTQFETFLVKTYDDFKSKLRES